MLGNLGLNTRAGTAFAAPAFFPLTARKRPTVEKRLRRGKSFSIMQSKKGVKDHAGRNQNRRRVPGAKGRDPDRRRNGGGQPAGEKTVRRCTLHPFRHEGREDRGAGTGRPDSGLYQRWEGLRGHGKGRMRPAPSAVRGGAAAEPPSVRPHFQFGDHQPEEDRLF